MIIKWRELTPTGETVEHDFDWAGAPRTKEMRWIKQRTEFKTTSGFLTALEEMDPDAITALVIILSARTGRTLKWDDVDVDPINELDFLLTDEERKRAGLIELLRDGKPILTDADVEPGKEDGPPVRASGTSNGLLSAAASKPSNATMPPHSGNATASTS
jgi:hypothetical protein